VSRAAGIGVGVVGMGMGLPAQVRENDWWPADFAVGHDERVKSDLVLRVEKARAREVDPEIARWAGEHRGDPFRGARRRRVVKDEQPSDLEARAGAAALADAGRSPADVDLLLVYSLLPDYPIPLNHGLVAEKLGLRKDVTACSVAAGCGSFVPQLAFAARMVAAGEAKTALIVQSAVVTPLIDFSAPSSVVAGDGAMAAVVAAVAPGLGYVGHRQVTRGEHHGAVRLAPAGGDPTPWHRSDLHGRRLTQQTHDPGAAATMGARAATYARETCLPLLEACGVAPADVDFALFTQPTAWFPRACCDALGIPHERTLDTFVEYAHIMAGSVPLNLHMAHQRGKLRPGDLVLVYAAGAGFVQAAGLLRWAR
jgi:3-oxoacyl-[acyl-carrier-protein] synthase-3